MSTATRRRLWIPLVIVALAAAALAVIWGVLDTSRQDRVVKTTEVLFPSALLLFIWAIALSGWRLKVRIATLAAVVLAVAAFNALFVVRGMTGDLIPIVELRFGKKAGPRDVAPNSLDDATIPASTPIDETAPEPAFDWRDSPQFLGPNRDATWPDLQLETDLTAHPPRLVWQRDVGPAWSGFAVRGRDAITQEQRGASECVVCYDLLTGEERWLFAVDARFDEMVGGVGPRATPTITRDRVHTVGATGILLCLDRADGAVVWSVDMLADNDGIQNTWGTSGSPLVYQDVVVVNPGGSAGRSVVAYDRSTGEKVWSGGDDGPGYASPQVATIHGAPQIVSFNQASVTGHDAQDGHVLWSIAWPKTNPNVAQPRVVSDDRVLVSSGYGVGCALYQIEATANASFQAAPLWKTLSLKAKFANFVVYDGHAYGLDDGIFVCVDLSDGRRKWKGGRYGHGQVIRTGDVLLLTGEFGEVILLAATPDEHRQLARFEAFDEKTWNTPTLAPPYLLVRSDQHAACYELAFTSP